METKPLSHYLDGIRNSEHESNNVEVPDTADNADRASIVDDRGPGYEAR